jgi:hypothetical protein
MIMQAHNSLKRLKDVCAYTFIPKLQVHSGDIRLQQSLSTPCPGGGSQTNLNSIGQQKAADYRRFKSEGESNLQKAFFHNHKQLENL